MKNLNALMGKCNSTAFIVALLSFLLASTGCFQGFQNSSKSSNETSTSEVRLQRQMKVYPGDEVQDLQGGGQVSLQEAINSQVADANHAAHMVHSGDDDKVMDHTALLEQFPKASDASVYVALKGGSFFNAGNWSRNQVPGNGARVYIPKGVSMVYDNVSSAHLDRMAVDGELHFAVDRNTLLYIDTLLTGPSSVFTIGTQSKPVQDGVTAKILFHRDKGPVSLTNDPKLMMKGLVAHGQSRIAGQDKVDHLKVVADHHPRAGENFLIFDKPLTGWKVGDVLVVGATSNTFGANNNMTFQDEVVKVTSITSLGGGRYRVNLNQSLKYNHVPPSHKANVTLRVSVANFSRNVIIATDTGGDIYQNSGKTVPTLERGHVMFMHRGTVSVQNAAFVELGRTDKNQYFSNMNVAGRYALHFHRTGTENLANPALARGNAIFGSPGWGIVHHDANLDVISNAVFGVQGSGIVAEAGNETGVWDRNIVIQMSGNFKTFNAEQSSDSNGNAPVNHPAYQSEIENNSFTQAEAYGMKSRLITVTNNIAVSARGVGFSFWPHGADGPSHIGANSRSFKYLHGYDPFFGATSVYPGKVPTRIFFGNEVSASRHALNTSANKIAHRHDMDVVIEDLLSWNVDQGIVSFYQENYLIKDCIFIKGKANETTPVDVESPATHIHDPVDFKMINNYFEGYGYVTMEPIQFIFGNVVVGANTTKQTGPDGLFREGFTADNDTIDMMDNSSNWRTSAHFAHPIGHLDGVVDLGQSKLYMDQYYDPFWVAIKKTDTVGSKLQFMGSPRSDEFRGASQKNWWKDNASNNGYYQQPDGSIYLIVEAVLGDRITATVGAVEVAIKLNFIKNPATDFPYGGVNNGPLPSRLNSNGVGQFRIVDKREFGKVGNLLNPDQQPHDEVLDSGSGSTDDHADHNHDDTSTDTGSSDSGSDMGSGDSTDDHSGHDMGGDTGSTDSGVDTGTDTGSGDSGADTGTDSGSGDSGADTGTDSGSGDSGADTGTDTGSGDSGSETDSGNAGNVSYNIFTGPRAINGNSSSAIIIEHQQRMQMSSGYFTLDFKLNRVDRTQGLFSKDSSGYDNGGHLTIEAIGKRLHLRVQSTSQSYDVYSSDILEANKQYRMQVSFNSSGMKLYLDGQLLGQTSYSRGLVSNTEPVVLGAIQTRSGDGVADRLEAAMTGVIIGADLSSAAPASSNDSSEDNVTQSPVEAEPPQQEEPQQQEENTPEESGDQSQEAIDFNLLKQALTMNGKVSQVAILPHSSDLEMANGELIMDIKASRVDLGEQGLFSKDSSGYDDGGHLSVSLIKNKVQVRIQSKNASYTLVSSDSIVAGQNVRLQIQFGSQGLKLFIDGKASGQNSYTGGLMGNKEPIVLGALQTRSGNLVADRIQNAFYGTILGVSLKNR